MFFIKDILTHFLISEAVLLLQYYSNVVYSGNIYNTTIKRTLGRVTFRQPVPQFDVSIRNGSLNH